jgi:predicted nuclease with TOPRIM domain
MRDQLENRLKELKSEFEIGQNKLAELEAQATNLRNMLLRISGAIQVLEEELDKAAQPSEMEQVQHAPSGNGTAKQLIN